VIKPVARNSDSRMEAFVIGGGGSDTGDSKTIIDE